MGSYIIKKPGAGQAYKDVSVTPEDVIWVTSVELNLRSGPSTSHAIVMTLPRGAKVLVRQQKKNVKPWVFVETADRSKSGFVHSQYLQTVSFGERSSNKLGFLNLVRQKIKDFSGSRGLLSIAITLIVSVLVYFGLKQSLEGWIAGATMVLTNKELLGLGWTHSLTAFVPDLYLAMAFEALLGWIIGTIVRWILDFVIE